MGEYKQFLGIARASNFELQTQLEISQTLSFGNPEQILEARNREDDLLHPGKDQALPPPTSINDAEPLTPET
jgi:hypothetical protein